MKLKKQFKIIFCLFLVTFTLNSCETLLHYKGNVYNDKNEPVENAKISLIIGKRDTMRKMGEILDTISIAQRKELRRKGIKDNFTSRMGEGLSEPKILFTDKSGHFETRTLWLGCGFSNCQEVKILVEKDGLIKTFLAEDLIKEEMKKDTLSVGFRFRKPKDLSLVL
jgi:hypothetical protein